MKRRLLSLLLIALGVAASGCSNRLRFKNMLPGATLENVRWTSPELIAYGPSDPLAPGAVSTSSLVAGSSLGSGTLSFDLVVNGTRVSLVGNDSVSVNSGEDTVVTIGADLHVHNPLLESDTSP